MHGVHQLAIFQSVLHTGDTGLGAEMRVDFSALDRAPLRSSNEFPKNIKGTRGGNNHAATPPVRGEEVRFGHLAFFSTPPFFFFFFYYFIGFLLIILILDKNYFL